MKRRTSKKCRNGWRPPEEYVNFPVKRMDTGREVVSAGKGNNWWTGQVKLGTKGLKQTEGGSLSIRAHSSVECGREPMSSKPVLSLWNHLLSLHSSPMGLDQSAGVLAIVTTADESGKYWDFFCSDICIINCRWHIYHTVNRRIKFKWKYFKIRKSPN